MGLFDFFVKFVTAMLPLEISQGHSYLVRFSGNDSELETRIV